MRLASSVLSGLAFDLCSICAGDSAVPSLWRAFPEGEKTSLSALAKSISLLSEFVPHITELARHRVVVFLPHTELGQITGYRDLVTGGQVRSDKHVHRRIGKQFESFLQLIFFGTHVIAEPNVSLDHWTANQSAGIQQLSITNAAHVICINGFHVLTGLRNKAVLTRATGQRNANQGNTQSGGWHSHSGLPFYLRDHNQWPVVPRCESPAPFLAQRKWRQTNCFGGHQANPSPHRGYWKWHRSLRPPWDRPSGLWSVHQGHWLRW